ncbi:carboxypeptidase-like regulatory domain-containing protein [Roseivirga sp. BDSF3-8]|uniref:carboxypeptidase-like regulatory domain-containing protein n=1 Tax=Roseivirga sp. BDSF3-8 TaxID=3241598 RepID=UPI0035319385
MKRLMMITALMAVCALSAFTFSEKGIFDTGLRITVIDELGNPVEGATVKIFANEKDYRAGENLVQEPQTSDEKGRVTFKDLESKVYFVDARKGDMNNNSAGVQTDKLKEKRLNKVNIVIE